MLYRQLATRLAPHPLYYLQSSVNVEIRWHRFVHTLRNQGRSKTDIDEACHGACDALIELQQ